MSLRGPATQHLHNERAKRASLMGRVGRVGRVDGWDGPEKCPLIFFILCEYIDKVYIYKNKKGEKYATSLWVSKFDVKLESWIFFFLYK